MEGTAHSSHTMYSCRGACFTDPPQAVLQQNGAHVPTHPAVSQPAPFRSGTQPLVPLRSCGDVRGVLWPIPSG